MRYAAFTIFALLSACASGPKFDQAQADANMAQLDAAAQQRCAKFGYQADRPDFNQCVFNVKSQFLQAVMVPAPSVPPISIQPPPQLSPSVQTHCYQSGQSINCSSY